MYRSAGQNSGQLDDYRGQRGQPALGDYRRRNCYRSSAGYILIRQASHRSSFTTVTPGLSRRCTTTPGSSRPIPPRPRPSWAPAVHNEAYRGRPDDRPWSERHNAVLWLAMILAVAVLAALAIRGLRAETKDLSS